ncbi:MAG: hypothetical protein AAF828_01115 [Bacteroidota bacterium]
MKSTATPARENKQQATDEGRLAGQQPTFQLVDKRPQAALYQTIQAMANHYLLRKMIPPLRLDRVDFPALGV